jgi:hypothetical protein
MSNLKTYNIQIGQSATATNNFVIKQPATPNGTLVIANGNIGSETNVFSINSLGMIVSEDWKLLPLVNSWVYYGAPWPVPAYYKDALGIVHLKGLIKSGVAGTVFTTLPVGYRPLESCIYVVSSNDVYGRVDVGSNGTIIAGANASPIWISLETITFRAV